MRKDQIFIEKKLGIDHANELWKLGIEAVDEAKKLISDYKIKCNLTKGVISAGCYENDQNFFLEEIDHMQKKYNFDGYEFFNKKEIKEEIDTDIYFSGLLNNHSYHINPLKFLIGLANELKKLSEAENSLVFFTSPKKINKIIQQIKKNFKGRKIVFFS